PPVGLLLCRRDESVQPGHRDAQSLELAVYPPRLSLVKGFFFIEVGEFLLQDALLSLDPPKFTVEIPELIIQVRQVPLRAVGKEPSALAPQRVIGLPLTGQLAIFEGGCIGSVLQQPDRRDGCILVNEAALKACPNWRYVVTVPGQCGGDE